MSGDLTLLGDSPFDAIRRVREDGSEYWSARDLQPLMGYARWESFLAPVERAMKTAANTAMDVTSNFRGSPKITSTRSGQDYELSRFAAYLTAMNGDPNKPEVAAAQAYFATKTREAEIAAPRKPMTELEMARRYVAALERMAELEPKAEAHDAFLSADGDFLIGTVAKMLGVGPNVLFRRLRDEHILIKGGRRHNTPYQQYAHHFRVVARTVEVEGGPDRTSFTTYVRPSGVDFIRKVLKMPAVTS